MKYYYNAITKMETLVCKCETCRANSKKIVIETYRDYERMLDACEQCQDCPQNGECETEFFSELSGNLFCEIASVNLDKLSDEINLLLEAYRREAFGEKLFERYDYVEAESYISSRLSNISLPECIKQCFSFSDIWSAYCVYNKFNPLTGQNFEGEYVRCNSYCGNFDEFMGRRILNGVKNLKSITEHCLYCDDYLGNQRFFNAVSHFEIIKVPRFDEFKYMYGPKDDDRYSFSGADDLIQSLYEYMDKNEQKLEEKRYNIASIKELLGLSFYLIVSDKLRLKKCLNCDGYFIARSRSDTLYCDRVSPQDKTKTCKEYGAMRTHKDNLKNNEAMGLYRKIYMSKQMLAKRNPDIPAYVQSFEKYKEQSKQWKAAIKKGVKSEAEFIDWLKSVKEKKVL